MNIAHYITELKVIAKEKNIHLRSRKGKISDKLQNT
jgi:hypothetical protein